MYTLAVNVGANRVVAGTKIPHPCGDPALPAQGGKEISRKLLAAALETLEQKLGTSPIVINDL